MAAALDRRPSLRLFGRETLRRFESTGLGWPLPNGMSEGDLEAALYANHGTKRGHRRSKRCKKLLAQRGPSHT